MKVTYDVNFIDEPAKKERRRSEEYYKILKFLKSDHENMCLSYASNEIAKKRKQSLYTTIRREEIPVTIKIKGARVYIFKR